MKKLISCLYLFGLSLATACTGAGLSFNENDADLITAINDNNPTEEQLTRASEGITDINSTEHAFLVRAAEKNNLQALEFLLKQGANPNLIDRHGRTALMEAVYSNHPQIVRELLMWGGTDPNIEEGGMGGNRTALMTAAAFERLEVVREFVDYLSEEDVNYQDTNSGMTALMWAAGTGNPQQGIITALCNAGSNLAAQDNKGRTAYAIAHKKGHGNILNLLRFDGCEPPQDIEQAPENAQPDTNGQLDEQNGTQVGTFNLNETEGDVEASDSALITNINMTADAALRKNQIGGINANKTKGKITLNNLKMGTDINIGERP